MPRLKLTSVVTIPVKIICAHILMVMAVEPSFAVDSDRFQICPGKSNEAYIWNMPAITNEKFLDEYGEEALPSPKIGQLQKCQIAIAKEEHDIYRFKKGERVNVGKKSFYKISYGHLYGWVDAEKVDVEIRCKEGARPNDVASLTDVVSQVQLGPNTVKSEAEFLKYFSAHVCDQSGNRSEVACQRFEKFNDVVKVTAKSFGLPYSVMACLATRESRWDWNADKNKQILVKNNNADPNKFAWGAFQIKSIAARDVSGRLRGKMGTTHGEAHIQKAWQVNLENLDAIEHIPGVRAAVAYVQIESIIKDPDYIAKHETLLRNTPINTAIASAHLKRLLFKVGMQEGEEPTVEQLTMAFGMYNRGENAFDEICNNLSMNECLNKTQRECKKIAESDEINGWYEGHRYMISLRNCIISGRQKNYDLEQGECPSL